MIPFDAINRFKTLDNGLLYSSAGVQTNCGGIAAILVKIERVKSKTLEFFAEDNDDWEGNIDSDSDVPGARVRTEYREAVFSGARKAFDNAEIVRGYRFILIEALIHPVDSREIKFYEAGYRVMQGWLNLEGEST